MTEINPAHFTVDESRLAEEWIAHPRRVFDYAQMAGKARIALDVAKRQDEVIRADVSLSVRRNPEAYGLTKVTEGLIDAVITTHKDVQESSQRIIQCKNVLELTMAAMAAMETKKKALECIVQLHATSYFANPRSPKSLETKIDDSYRAPGIAPKKLKTAKQAEASASTVDEPQGKTVA